MNKIEISNLFKRINNHYNMFTISEEKIEEWYKFLKDYDSDEVNEQLDKYLMNNYESSPQVYHLTKNLTRKEQEDDIWITECDICKQRFRIVNNDMEEFEKHHRKCQKIDFIDRMSMRYKKKHIASVVYYEMSDEELDNAYREIMDYYVAHRDNTKIFKKIPQE